MWSINFRNALTEVTHGDNEAIVMSALVTKISANQVGVWGVAVKDGDLVIQWPLIYDS